MRRDAPALGAEAEGTEPRPSILTPHDLGQLLEEADYLGAAGQERFLEFVRTDPRLSPIYRKLKSLAADIGYTGHKSIVYALDCHHLVDELEAADGRLSVRRVLEPIDKYWEEDLNSLILIIEARAARAQDPSRLLAIKRKLETARRKFKERYGC